MKIMVADAHESQRAGLATVARQLECTVVAEASDGPSAMIAFLECQPDIAVLGVDLPGLSGGAMASSLAADGGHTVIVAGIDILAVVSRSIIEREQEETGRLELLLDALARAGMDPAGGTPKTP